MDTDLKLSNNFQAYMNNVKVFIDIDYLTIPNVFSQVGLVGGLILYPAVAFLNSITMDLVLQVARIYSEKKDANGRCSEVRSYTDLAERINGRIGKTVVTIFIFIVQFSCCVGYQYFVAMVADRLICNQTQYCNHENLYKLIIMIIAIPLSLVKTYTHISYVSIFGIFCACIGGFMLMGFCGNLLSTN